MKTFFGVILVLSTGLIGIPWLVVDALGMQYEPYRSGIEVRRQGGHECARYANQQWTCYRINDAG